MRRKPVPAAALAALLVSACATAGPNEPPCDHAAVERELGATLDALHAAAARADGAGSKATTSEAAVSRVRRRARRVTRHRRARGAD